MAQAMLTQLYIEALLVDEELADQVWVAWFGGKIDDLRGALAWLWVATLMYTTCSAWGRSAAGRASRS